MKNYSIVLAFIFLITVAKVSATVGGPLYVYDFTYNPKDESVYYMNIDGGGRGCPPTLMKISLNSEKSTTVFSCDQAEKITQEQGNNEINTITNGFKFLTPLSLKRNAILVDVIFVKSENYSPESNEVLMRHFTATVYQNGKKIKEIPITGCSLDQPFTFQGYAIPGFNKKIILLISKKSNCFEGGYITESLQVVGGVDNLDKEVKDNFYKGANALLPNEGNLVVYESDKVTISNSTTSTDVSVKTATSTTVPSSIDEATLIKKESFLARLIAWFKNLF